MNKLSVLIFGVFGLGVLSMNFAFAYDMGRAMERGKKMYPSLQPVPIPGKFVGAWAGIKAKYGQTYKLLKKNGVGINCFVGLRSKRVDIHKSYAQQGSYFMLQPNGLSYKLTMKGKQLTVIVKSGVGDLDFQYTRVKAMPKGCIR